MKLLSKTKLQEIEYRNILLTERIKYLEKELMNRRPIKGNYTRKPLSCLSPEDIMTVNEFISFPYGFGDDGTAYPMKNGKEDNSKGFNKDCLWNLPLDATHISWYNK